MANSNIDIDLLRRRVYDNLNDAATKNSDEYHYDQKDEKLQTKQSPYCFQNFVCLGVAVAVFYFTDFLNVILYDASIKSTWFWSGALFLSVHLGILVYIVFYQSFWKKLHSDEWETKFPRVFPIATSAFIIGMICFSVSLWPVWGFLTPLIFLSLFLGGVVIIAMIG